MTGYGAFTIDADNYKVTVELKSLNSKYFELNLKLPKSYSQYELKLRNFLSQYLGRGKVSANLGVEVLNTEKKHLRINKALVRNYLTDLNSMREEMNITHTLDLPFLLSLPDVIQEEPETNEPEEWKLIELSFQNASRELRKSRIHEGKALERDLRIRIEIIHRQLDFTEKDC